MKTKGYTPILGTLGYVLSPDGNQVLMVHRNKREKDHHLGKYNGLGGKLEPSEDVASCMCREIQEEAGIECKELQLRGTINWTGFGPHGEDWLGFIFLITKFEGEPFQENEEGKLLWVPLSELNSLPMWEGDKYFLPLVFDQDPKIFHGFLPYKNSEPQSWNFTRI